MGHTAIMACEMLLAAISVGCVFQGAITGSLSSIAVGIWLLLLLILIEILAMKRK